MRRRTVRNFEKADLNRGSRPILLPKEVIFALAAGFGASQLVQARTAPGVQDEGLQLRLTARLTASHEASDPRGSSPRPLPARSRVAPADRLILRSSHALHSQGQRRESLHNDLPSDPLPRPAVDAAPGGGAAPVAVLRAREGGAPAPGEVLLLDLVINGRPQQGVAVVERTSAGEMLLSEPVWRQARFVETRRRRLSDGSIGYALDDLPGIQYRLDRSALRLDIKATAAAFLPTVLDPPPLPPLAERPQPGLLLNYDINIRRETVARRVGTGLLELLTFGKGGSLANSALVHSDPEGSWAERLDTTWRYDMPDRMESVVVGDTIGVAGGWSRPVRFGGIRWGRNYQLRPGFITYPIVQMSGEAALPSAVDVLVNQSSRMREQVQPGPFSIQHVPLVNGAGEVTVVVRDLLGREQVVTQSYYSSPLSLAPGLQDFSLEAGWLRTGYGRFSRYGDVFAAGTLRRGLSDHLTGEARVEVQGDRRAAGVELVAVLGSVAVARAAVASSFRLDATGTEYGEHYQLGLERSTPQGGVYLRYEHAERGFAPFGEGAEPAARTRRMRDLVQFGFGMPVWGRASLGASFVTQERHSGERFRIAGMTLNMPLAERLSLVVSASRRLGPQSSWSSMVSLWLPLERGVYTGMQLNRAADGTFSGGVVASSSTPNRRGLDWRLEASSSPGQETRAALTYNTAQGELGLELAGAPGRYAGRTSARGAVGILNRVPFATRFVGEHSIAVVDANGVGGVPILLSHQVSAHTDERGIAIIPELLPWQLNRLEIDPATLPLDVEVGAQNVVRQVVPFGRSATAVHFPLRRVRQALILLQDANGVPMEIGTKVQIQGRDLTVGRRGEVWVDDLPSSGPLRLRLANGGCELSISVPAPSAEGTPARLGPFSCQRE